MAVAVLDDCWFTLLHSVIKAKLRGMAGCTCPCGSRFSGTCFEDRARPRGWPARPNEYVQIIENNYILPNMVAKTVTGTPIKEAIAWGEVEVRKVLEGKAG